MTKDLLFIDKVSVGWEHKDFNKYYIEDCVKIYGVSFQTYTNEEMVFSNALFKGSLEAEMSFFKLLLYVVKTRPQVIFLCLTKKEYLLLLFLSLFTGVSFIVHKYNVNAAKFSMLHRAFYKLVGALKVKALYQDIPLTKYFIGECDPVNPFRRVERRKSDKLSNIYIRRVLFVGSGSEDKSPAEAIAYARSMGYSFLQLCDVNEHTIQLDEEKVSFDQYQYKNGDVIWGCYNTKDYLGVQSGLPFVSLSYGIPILVRSRNSFMKFSEVCEDYLIMKE